MVIETAIALLLIFGALVMFHELGHFITARLVGMRVDEFAFGFGPKLIRLLKRGDTEYTIHPFPLGGFVKIAGMEPGEEDIPDGFQAQARWKRALVIFSGPFASFIFAALAFVFLGTVWGFPTDKTINRVLMVQPQTVAAEIGLRAGDRIVSIDGQKVTSGEQMVNIIHGKPGEEISLVVERDGKRQHKTAVPNWSIAYLGARWSFMQGKQAEVEFVSQGSAAEKAGIIAKDKLVSINGVVIESGKQMVQAVQSAGDKRTKITLNRGDELVTVTADPQVQWVQFAGTRWAFPDGYAEKTGGANSPVELYDQIVSIEGQSVATGRQMIDIVQAHKNGALDIVVKRDGERKSLQLNVGAGVEIESGYYDAVGLLGFLPEFELQKAGFVESIRRGLEKTWTIVGVLVYALAPSRIGENVGGPVLIAQQTSMMVALGPYYVVQMAGMLSLSLAFINLLPIPVLDGGHLAILSIEAIRRKRLTPQQMQAAQMVGLVIIVTLVMVVLWNDIWKLTHGMVPR